MSFRHAITSVGSAIDYDTGALTGQQSLSAILIQVDTAPTTSESLTVTLDSADGSYHDVVLYSKDLVATTSVANTDISLPLFPGDGLKVAYTNTDQRNIGVRLVLT
jgi:hypothetical protein